MNNVSNPLPTVLPQELVRTVGRTGMRYGCYPPLADFDAQCGPEHYRAAVRARDAEAASGLSLYVHLPFCYASCAFCHCSKLVTRDGGKATRYLGFLYEDIALQGALLRARGPVQRMYWGGGTPTYYSAAQLQRIYTRLREHFEFAPDGEYLIEVDPRTVNESGIAALREMGFNIVSFGIPDLDPGVLQAVTRVQTAEQSLEAVAAAHRSGYRTVAVELMYGLPQQTEATFGAALERVVGARPDRIVLHDYVHAPRRYRTQRQIDQHQLPRASEKVRLLTLAVQYLAAAGYLYLGPDYFVKPDDSLAAAQSARMLHYDMLGYSAAGASDVVPVGASAVGTMGAFHSQNESDLGAYYEKVGAGELPIVRGAQLSADDRVRAAVIRALLCDAQVSIPAIESAHAIAFERYFQSELAALDPYVRAALVHLGGGVIALTAAGRLWARNVCSVFDRYRLPRGPGVPSASVA